MDASAQVFEIKRANKSGDRWRLVILPERLRFEQVEGNQVRVVPAADWHSRLLLAHLTGAEGLIALRTEGKEQFRAPANVIEAVRTWAPPPTREDLVRSLRSRAKWLAMWGTIALLLAATEAQFLTASLDVEAVMLAALGVVLLIAAPVGRWRPHRAVFLAETAAWLIVGGTHVLALVQGRATTMNWVLAVVSVPLSLFGWQQFRKYARTTTVEAIQAERRAQAQSTEPLDPVVETP